MRTAAALAALLCLSAPAMAQDAATAFAGRSLARALDDRCGLYSETQRGALDAAWLQARGAMIRSGQAPEDLDILAAGYARRAQPMACESADAQAIAADVAAAFENLTRLREMDFPGSDRVWHASRPYPGYPAWTLAQYPEPGDASRVFGFFHAEGERRLSLGLPDAAGLSTARIVMRDTEAEPALIDPSLGGLLTVPGRPAWVRFAPPAHAETAIFASGRETAETGLRFVFPDRAVDALAGLDPRETVRVEVMDARGRVTETHFVEVGDFAAGAAFLSAASELSGATGG